MTDLAAIDLAIEAIARMPDGTNRDDRGEATRRLLAMRDTVPTLAASVDALITRIRVVSEERDKWHTYCDGARGSVVDLMRERDHERERADRAEMERDALAASLGYTADDVAALVRS